MLISSMLQISTDTTTGSHLITAVMEISVQSTRLTRLNPYMLSHWQRVCPKRSLQFNAFIPFWQVVPFCRAGKTMTMEQLRTSLADEMQLQLRSLRAQLCQARCVTFRKKDPEGASASPKKEKCDPCPSRHTSHCRPKLRRTWAGFCSRRIRLNQADRRMLWH